MQVSLVTSQYFPAPQVEAPGEQESVDSLQLSLPLQVMPSEQGLRPLAVQTPAWQLSIPLQKRPSLQKLPSSSATNVVVL